MTLVVQYPKQMFPPLIVDLVPEQKDQVETTSAGTFMQEHVSGCHESPCGSIH